MCFEHSTDIVKFQIFVSGPQRTHFPVFVCFFFYDTIEINKWTNFTNSKLPTMQITSSPHPHNWMTSKPEDV